MKRLRFCLTLALALLCLGTGAWLPARGAALDSLVPAGLTPDAWQANQSQVAKLTAADGAAYSRFGVSVSVSGDTAVVGDANDLGGDPQGGAYVYYRNQNGPDAWGQVAKLTTADGADGDGFGYSVSLSGDIAVVGAPWTRVGGNLNQGMAYVFYRDQGGPDAWGQVAKLAAFDGAAYSRFGLSVSVSGDTAVVGAWGATVGGVPQGAAYVFYRNQGGPDAWDQVAKLTADDGATADRFGHFVSVSGDAAVVGAIYADVGGNQNQGAAYVFYRDQGGADAWGQVAKLTAADGAAWEQFGSSVSVDGDTAVAGAVLAYVGGNLDQGAAYVFYRDQGGPDACGQPAKLTAHAAHAGD